MIGLVDCADGLSGGGGERRQMTHQNFGVKIYRTDGVCTSAHPQRWWEKCELPRLGASLKPAKSTVLSANTLDIRRNCRHNRMLGHMEPMVPTLSKSDKKNVRKAA